MLLRGAAEAVKSEIFKYRMRAGTYNAEQCRTGPRELKLVQEIDTISDRLQQSEVGRTALLSVPYAKEEDPAPLTPSKYVHERVENQISFIDAKARTLSSRLHRLQGTILLLGGAGTFLGAIGWNVWIALSVAAAAALTTKLETDQTENSLIQYNQSLSGLRSILAWWSALTAGQKESQANTDLLVEHTERVLDTGLTGWLQNMQNALEKLRKQQTEPQEIHVNATAFRPVTAAII